MPSPLQRIVRVAVPVPLDRLFDYGVPGDQPMPPNGARVAVPFRGRTLVGVVMEPNPADAHPSVKPIHRALDAQSLLDDELLALARWLAAYYVHPIGEVLATLLPGAARKPTELSPREPEVWTICTPEAGLERAPRQRELYRWLRDAGGNADAAAIRQAGFNRSQLNALAGRGLVARRARAPAESGSSAPLTPSPSAAAPELNREQQAAIDALTRTTGYATTLLDGVTGSGKTEVYLRFMATVLARGRQVLVLVPEIALTPQTLARFEARFGSATVLHSGMTDAARLEAWLSARRGEAKILIGTRSAVLTPFADLGLIVVDEEHDSSFKQGDGLRYSARDVAVKRARDLEIPLILGSATPSFESLRNAMSGRYAHVRLLERAGGASLPTFHLVDIRGHTLNGGLSEPLLAAIRRQLDAGAQVLVFLNRRGFAPSMLCGHCRWQGRCAACDWPMTVHHRPEALICHHCGHRERLPEACPDCGHSALIAIGAGTQRCEAVLAESYPDVPVYRIDRDTTRSQRRLEEQLAAVASGRPAILVGTQMLAKGHHFPEVSLVAVVNADGGFVSPDFRAPERTAQLIIQVAGRAGRAERPGEVYVQTHQPDNPLLTGLLEGGYAEFAAQELESRRAAGLPPFRPMALARAESADADSARRWLARLGEQVGPEVDCFGPAPAIIPRVADRARYQLMLSAASRGLLHRTLSHLAQQTDAPRGVRWSLDVDPYDTF